METNLEFNMGTLDMNESEPTVPTFSMKALGVAITFLAILFATIAYVSQLIPKTTSFEQCQSVREGMTKRDVFEILGPPEKRFGDDTWIYPCESFGWKEPNRVEFGPDDRVIRVWCISR